MDAGAAIALTLVGATVVGVAAAVVLSKLKGKIEVKLEDRPYKSGEAVQGAIIIHAHKYIEAERLTVSLKCQTRSDRDKKAGWTTVYSEPKELFGQRPIAAGGKVEARFSFTVPLEVDVAKQWGIPDISIAGIRSQTYLRAQIQWAQQVQWLLEVHLAAKGLDLYHNKAVVIQGPNIF